MLPLNRQLDQRFAVILGQRRNTIVALEAIIAAGVDLSAVNPERVKQKVKESKIFGPLDADDCAAIEQHAMRVLGQT